MKTPASEILGKAVVKAPGTCGELAQGMIGGEHFLITCPVDIYATAEVEITGGRGIANGPDDCPKSLAAIELTLEYLGVTSIDANLTLASSLPRGKGMASSTADVTAAIQATALALGSCLSPAQIANIALQVEPSDGIMFPGIALFDHRQGRTVRLLGEPPPMRVLVLDFGGSVDTLEFNGKDRSEALRKQESQCQKAVDFISEGLRSGSVGLISQGATISSLIHQEILYKPQLDAVIKLSSEVGAAGVNVAHSGTVIGMLFDDNDSLLNNALSRAKQCLPGLENVFQARVIGGGLVPVTYENQEILDWQR